MALPSRLSLLLNYLGVHISSKLTWNECIDITSKKASQTLNFVKRNFSSCPTISVSSVTKHLWDLSWSMLPQYGTTVSKATSTKSNRFSGTLHVSPVVITDGYLLWQPCCGRCSGIHFSNDELAAGSWCCTESEMVSSPYLLQPTLNQFPSAPEGSKRDVQIQCNTGTYSQTIFPSASRLWNILPVDICQLSHDSFKTHLSSFHFIWAPDYVLFLPRDAMHARYKPLACVCLSVCLSVSLHVTSRSSTKTDKRSITQTTTHDSPGTQVFWRQRSPRNSTGSPPTGRQMQIGWVEIGDFRQITGYIYKFFKSTM